MKSSYKEYHFILTVVMLLTVMAGIVSPMMKGNPDSVSFQLSDLSDDDTSSESFMSKQKASELSVQPTFDFGHCLISKLRSYSNQSFTRISNPFAGIVIQPPCI